MYVQLTSMRRAYLVANYNLETKNVIDNKSNLIKKQKEASDSYIFTRDGYNMQIAKLV